MNFVSRPYSFKKYSLTPWLRTIISSAYLTAFFSPCLMYHFAKPLHFHGVRGGVKGYNHHLFSGNHSITIVILTKIQRYYNKSSSRNQQVSPSGPSPSLPLCRGQGPLLREKRCHREHRRECLWPIPRLFGCFSISISIPWGIPRPVRGYFFGMTVLFFVRIHC